MARCAVEAQIIPLLWQIWNLLTIWNFDGISCSEAQRGGSLANDQPVSPKCLSLQLSKKELSFLLYLIFKSKFMALLAWSVNIFGF